MSNIRPSILLCNRYHSVDHSPVEDVRGSRKVVHRWVRQQWQPAIPTGRMSRLLLRRLAGDSSNQRHPNDRRARSYHLITQALLQGLDVYLTRGCHS